MIYPHHQLNRDERCRREARRWETPKTVFWPDDPVLALPAVGRLWPSFIRSHLLESKAHTYEVDFGRDIGEAVYLFENFDAIFVEHEREQWFDGIYWNGLD